MVNPEPIGVPSQLFSYQTQSVALDNIPLVMEISVAAPLQIVVGSDKEIMIGEKHIGGSQF
jgi:hypothetical protein